MDDIEGELKELMDGFHSATEAEQNRRVDRLLELAAFWAGDIGGNYAGNDRGRDYRCRHDASTGRPMCNCSFNAAVCDGGGANLPEEAATA